MLSRPYALSASCRDTLSEEGLDEDEIEDELAMLRVQRAFVLHKMGRKKEAIEIYKALQAAGFVYFDVIRLRIRENKWFRTAPRNPTIA